MTIEYDQLDKCGANHVALSPISFLHRTADIYPDHTSLVYHSRSHTWAQTRERCLRIASTISALGIGRNDTVSVFAYNTPQMFECHYSVPMSGAVLNTINTRLDADTVAYIIDHAESKMFITDRALWPVLEQALALSERQPLVVLIDDEFAGQEERPEIAENQEYLEYETLVERGDSDFSYYHPQDEWEAISLNYTSGTTGRPKGVVYHHRGAYLMSMGTAASWSLPHMPRYLYSVPMFHCNGWGHAWTMTLKAATIHCLRAFEPVEFFQLLKRNHITHFGGAPIILNMLANAPESAQEIFTQPIKCMTAGAPPPASVLQGMRKFGFEVRHVYGLTETYGHVVEAAPQDAWLNENEDDLAALMSRQGVRFAMLESTDVLDPETGKSVPRDGETMGEIVIRGNVNMKGYLKDPAATAAAFKDDWFWSGDLAVIHPDGYIQIKDRAKDIIISGGENISSVEVENILYTHPAVGDAAVVAMSDKKWGEVPCAFVELKPDHTATEEELIAHCASNMAKFKKPKKVVFGELPKTATGKIQKVELRKRCS